MIFDKAKTLRAAEKYLELGKIPAAINEYTQIVTNEPDDFSTINTLGDLHVRVGNQPAAIALTVRNDFLLTDDAAAARAGIEGLARFMRQPPDVVRRRVWVGDRAEVADGLAAFAAAGFDEAILALAPPYDATTIAMLERAARDLVPALACPQT